MRLLRRLGARFRRVGTAEVRPSPAPGLVRKAGRLAPIVPMAKSRGERPVALVAAWGLAGDGLERLVEVVSRDGEPATTPVFLSDCPDFDVFRRHRVPFEYLPLGALGDWPGDAESYLVRRFELYLSKYHPAALVAFGAEAVARLRAIAASGAATRATVEFLAAAGHAPPGPAEASAEGGGADAAVGAPRAAPAQEPVR